MFQMQGTRMCQLQREQGLLMPGEQLPLPWGRESWSKERIREELERLTGRKEETHEGSEQKGS